MVSWFSDKYLYKSCHLKRTTSYWSSNQYWILVSWFFDKYWYKRCHLQWTTSYWSSNQYWIWFTDSLISIDIKTVICNGQLAIDPLISIEYWFTYSLISIDIKAVIFKGRPAIEYSNQYWYKSYYLLKSWLAIDTLNKSI